MSLRPLSESDKDQLKTIFSDLKKLFSMDEIKASDVDECITNLSSAEAKSFIKNLSSGTKPETALRESFFAGQSILSRHIASEMIPEVNTGDGFIDYKMILGNRFILLELKPLFEPEIQKTNDKRELVKLKQKKLNWEDHIEQILKYIQKGGEYIIITDLKDWYFFDNTVTTQKCIPFFKTNFLDLENDLVVTDNIYNLIERYKYQSVREDLDEHFFDDLKVWIDKLRDVDFEVNEDKKIELVLGIINKFIFIATLQDHGIIEYRWIIQRWKSTGELWGSRLSEVLTQFFEDTIKWFFKSYDTELFTENEINYIKKDSTNINKFYNVFKQVVGLSYLESDIGGQRGILQYNFRFIDEDIFGRAYEEYLAYLRHEEGIYYTPSYITQIISEKTLIKRIDDIILTITEALEHQDFEKAKNYLREFIEIKIIDPSCGSGSFLVKAFRIIWIRYKLLQEKIQQLIKEIDVYDTLTRNTKTEVTASNLQELKTILGFDSNRELISKLLLRHIHGNDLDHRAVSIAKVNLWLEAIKQSPKDFVYEKLPEHTNRILPYLDMNIVNGDCVVNLPEDLVLKNLQNYKKELSEMSNLRKEYHHDSTKEQIVSKIKEIKKSLREKLLLEFAKYLKDQKIEPKFLDSTMPMFWELEFWYAFFDEKSILKKNDAGFDCVIGNPPYERIQVINSKTSAEYGEFLKKSGYAATTGNYDLAVIFIEKGFKLLKNHGQFGYIVTNKFVQGDYGKGLRNFLSKNHAVREIVDFGDQQVFKKKATTYTSLLFLQKENISHLKYTLVKKLESTYDQLHEIEMNDNLENSKISVFKVDSSNLTENPWVFASSSEDEIIKKFEGMDTLEKVSDIFVGLQTSADPVYIIPGKDTGTSLEIISKKLNKSYFVEKELFKPILTGKDVKRWEVNWRDTWLFFPYLIKNNKSELISEDEMKKNYPKTWQYLVDHKQFLDEREKGAWTNRKNWHAYVYEKNLIEFSKPKIMTGVLANRSSFTLDVEGKYYFVGGGNAGVYGVALKDSENISNEYLVGLLNSSLLDWLVRKKTSKFHGGYFSYAKRFIESLPIITPSNNNLNLIKNIEKIVPEIIKSVEERKIIEKLWEKWSEQMKDVDRTLLSILDAEEQYIKENEKDYLWFDDTLFLISKGQVTLLEEFEDFEIRSGSDSLSLEILGFAEAGNKIIFTMKCKEQLLADHLYLCIRRSISSRTKLNTLQQLFEKTLIPVLQPNPSKKTENIMKKVYDEFGENDKKIIKIDINILEKEAEIDAIIFKLYNLELNDLNLVFTNLSTSDFYNGLVEKYFRIIAKKTNN